MKRIGILFLLVAVLSGAAFAQADISGIGTDFENLIEQLGEDMLPNLEQSAIWGQFPGQAALPDDSRFFFTMSAGAVLGFNGLLSFVEPTNAAFEILNVYELVQEIVAGSEQADDLITFIQGFFPYPVARSALGFRLPAGFEAMVDFAIFPQFLANTATNLIDAVPPFEMNTLHVGTRVRKVLLQDAPGVPAVSVGAGYSYTGFNLAYDFTGMQGISTAIGELNLAGELYLRNRINSFGLDLQVSKQLGFFVPFVGISPYYQLAAFSGGVGTTTNEFDAYVDFSETAEERDIPYDGDPPATTLSDNDLSFVVFGGFDLVFGNLALQVHSSYSVGEGWPAVTIGTRWQ
ncbi:MAG: hypothetical protein KOO61_08410 [Spirochaetales bacterium]|nr:hypothetical protein [Spirochaetales bacterium]